MITMADKRQFLLSAIVLPSLNNFYIFFRYIGNGPGLTGIVGSGLGTGSRTGGSILTFTAAVSVIHKRPIIVTTQKYLPGV